MQLNTFLNLRFITLFLFLISFNSFAQNTIKGTLFEKGTKNLLADLSDEVGVVWDGGFLGLTIHPNFGTTGKNYFYVFYSSEDSNNKDFPDFYSTLGCDTEEFWGNYLVLERFEVNPITLKLKTGSRSLLLKLRMYGTTHRGGGLQFGNDGFL